MFSALIFCLNTVVLGKSWEIIFQCKNTTTNGIFNFCRNPFCNNDTAVQLFCENVYEQVFKCPPKNIPFFFICDGVNHCANGIDEDPVICNLAICKKNFYKCSQNKCIAISRLCDGFKDCENGIDESPLVCRKLISKDNISCPFIFKENHIVTCYIAYGNIPGIISCNGILPPMTVAEITCKTFYISTGVPNQRIVCQHNGTWDQHLIRCKPDCGVVSKAKFIPLILNGWPIRPILWPWYAALFALENKQWIFFCSSTLIAKNIAVTAAHCIWDMPKENIKMVAGKFFSDFYVVEPNSQTSEVQELIIHPIYQDSLGNYASDIALIILSEPFFLTESVLPICLNLTLRNFLQENDDNLEGMVIGMGITENASISSNLQATTVQIINNKDCINDQTYEFRKYVTISSFCARGKNRTGVCNGDSGSGLARINTALNTWILEGIVSISPKDPNNVVCNINDYSIYTNVGMYSDWIYKYFFRYAID